MDQVNLKVIDINFCGPARLKLRSMRVATDTWRLSRDIVYSGLRLQILDSLLLLDLTWNDDFWIAVMKDHAR